MTTGCICPSCGGLTPQRGEPCRGCEIAAMPPGIGKTVSAAAHRLLYGAPIQAAEMFGPCDTSAARSAEAGS
jgi:hypothetical protein